MAKKLTRKQKGFVKDIVEGETGVKSALNNYDTEDYRTANAIAVENLQKPAIIDALEKALPDDLLAKKHLEGLFATRGIYRQTKEYTWVKIDEEPDLAVVHKYLDSAYRIKGKYKTLDTHTQPLIIQISNVIAEKYGINRVPGSNNQ